MDEKMIEITTEQDIEVVNSEIIENKVVAEESEQYVATEEVGTYIEVEATKDIVIEVDEAVGWISGDIKSHYSLTGRNDPNQHEIKSITGLSDELDELKRIKSVYADKINVANYYKWNDVAYDESGYFVSIVPNTSIIKICDGSDVFGISVDGAGFIGGQDTEVPRDNSYGLIATSGIVDVRCELEVNVGDCVVSNAWGYAKKADSDYGYKVLAIENKNGVKYAVILLGVQADITNALGNNLLGIDKRLDTAETNIISAINIANQAYNKAAETVVSNKEISDKVDGALGTVDRVVYDVENLESQVLNSVLISAQAKAIAESAATSAESMHNEAVEKANEAMTSVGNLITELEPITEWVDPNNENNVGATYFTEYMVGGINSKVDIETFESGMESGFSAIQRNAKEISSLVVSIDKYSVGEYSQAHGFSLDQAKDLIKDGMIYVPTELHEESYPYTSQATTVNVWSEDEKNTDKVYYVSESGIYWYFENGAWRSASEIPVYIRSFVPEYLYMWDRMNETGQYRWITIDKNYNPVSDTNTSAKSVYFTTQEPAVANNFGYWYTNGGNVIGKSGDYYSYTLYKWSDDHWVAVATLSGNVNNRAISQIRQDANEVATEIVNARGSAASLSVRIEDTESEIQDVVSWTKDDEGNQYNLATIKRTAEDAGADIALVVQEKDGEKVVNGASIAMAINSQTGDSFVSIEGKYLNLKGQVTFESFTKETQDKIEADTIDVQIWSSRGNIFKSGDTATVLTCHVFKAGVDITDTLPNSAFTWEKINNDGTKDERWTATPYGNNANAIQITSGEVWSRAMFNCAVTF